MFGVVFYQPLSYSTDNCSDNTVSATAVLTNATSLPVCTRTYNNFTLHENLSCLTVLSDVKFKNELIINFMYSAYNLG